MWKLKYVNGCHQIIQMFSLLLSLWIPVPAVGVGWTVTARGWWVFNLAPGDTYLLLAPSWTLATLELLRSIHFCRLDLEVKGLRSLSACTQGSILSIWTFHTHTNVCVQLTFVCVCGKLKHFDLNASPFLLNCCESWSAELQYCCRRWLQWFCFPVESVGC